MGDLISVRCRCHDTVYQAGVCVYVHYAVFMYASNAHSVQKWEYDGGQQEDSVVMKVVAAGP